MCLEIESSDIILTANRYRTLTNPMLQTSSVTVIKYLDQWIRVKTR